MTLLTVHVLLSRVKSYATGGVAYLVKLFSVYRQTIYMKGLWKSTNTSLFSCYRIETIVFR